MRRRMKVTLAGCALVLGCNAAPTTLGTAQPGDVVHRHGVGHGQHVLLLSIDGFHDFDLTNYVTDHPASALASLVARGTVYANAYSTAPSDSFPATLAMTTGGSPSSTGIYYDAMYYDN